MASPALPPIIIDTREQKPFEFPGHVTVSRKLDTGDYSIEGFEHLLTIERKMPGEMYSMCAGSRLRFQKELARMQEMNAAGGFAHVVIEGSMQFVLDSQGFARNSPASVLRSISTWTTERGIHFQFAGGKVHGESRDETARGLSQAWTFNMLSRWHRFHGNK